MEEQGIATGAAEQGLELDALAVFSHPDDVELSAGGTLLKLKSLGYRTGACDATRGEMGTRAPPRFAPARPPAPPTCCGSTCASTSNSRTATSG
jgi:LmbE family N-acetylglucosaminyl deacetylase